MQGRLVPFLTEFRTAARAVILASLLALASAAAVATPVFVQVGYADPQLPVNSLAVKLAKAQTAGNLNVVAVAWNDTASSVVSVSDTRGNTYRLAGTPTAYPGVATQAIYYAENIAAAAAGANLVTVAFDAPAPFVDVRVAEYGGIVAAGSFDGAAGNAGSSTLTVSGELTTTNANDLLVGANYVAHTTTGAGPGYTSRVITDPDRSIVEDRVVTATGTYTATAPQTRSNWYVMHVAAFRAADSGGAPPTVTLSATPTSVTSGSIATLNWSAPLATSCTASGGWSGPKAITGSATTGVLTATTSYTLTCISSGGSTAEAATVTVTAVTPAPTLTLSASPTTLATGDASTLTWSSSNATGCTASGGWTGTKATSGSATTGALSASTTFSLSCTGAGGSIVRSTLVTVTPPPPAPTVTLSANPTTVAGGTGSTLTWSSTNATSCAASGGWTGTKATAGSQSTGALATSATFVLNCTGAGGTNGKSVTVAVTPASASRFPLHVEAGERYLVDARGKPFLLQGDAAWSLIVGLTREQADQYLEDRRARGFNTVLVNLIEHYYSANPPNNVYGDGPFLVKGDFSTPNDAYFDHAEYVIAKAREKGLLVLLTPAYLGYSGGSQGWYQEMKANGPTKLRGYGQYIASRFRGYDNVLWVQGGDYAPSRLTEVRAVVNGIEDVETTKLSTFHASRGTAALQFLGAGETWLGVNNIYTNSSDVVAEAFGEYARSTMPFFLIEARYEGESGGSEKVVRQQAWQAVLSGAFGHVMGNRPIWLFDPGWQTALGSPGSSTVGYLRTLLEPRAWWTLVPDIDSTLVTAGRSSGTPSQSAAALAGDRSFAVITLPTVRDITVNLSKLAGPNVGARWYDPTNGTFSSIAGSPFGASGERVFRPTGLNSRSNSDWVLLLESAP